MLVTTQLNYQLESKLRELNPVNLYVLILHLLNPANLYPLILHLLVVKNNSYSVLSHYGYILSTSFDASHCFKFKLKVKYFQARNCCFF